MARSSPSSPLLAVLVAALTTLLLAPATAHAAADCIGALVSANTACSSEIAAVRDGKAPSSVSRPCCKAAVGLFTDAFAADCACSSTVAPYRDLLDSARSAAVDKCAGSVSVDALAFLPACPDSGGVRLAATAAAAAVPAAAPTWGTGSVCASMATGSRNCATKCTPRSAGANPTQAQINSAKRCANSARGYCDGLGAGGATTGSTVCGTGFPVPDPSPGSDGVSRQCFQCCVTRLVPRSSTSNGRNACVNPNRRRGGGGGCFPGSATVVVEDGSAPAGHRVAALRDVKVGDRVLSVDSKTGKPAFETVYFFGHQLPQASSEFVRLEVVSADGDDQKTAALELTRKHLVPVVAPGKPADLASAVYTRAMDVPQGARVLLVDGPSAAGPRVAVVASAKSVARAEGLYAPLTTGGGHIVVDGVLASVHSNNMLDPLAQLLDRRDLLQWAYETFGASVLKAAYRAVGPDAMAKAAPIVSALGLGDAAQLAVGVRGLVGLQQQAPKTA